MIKSSKGSPKAVVSGGVCLVSFHSDPQQVGLRWETPCGSSFCQPPWWPVYIHFIYTEREREKRERLMDSPLEKKGPCICNSLDDIFHRTWAALFLLDHCLQGLGTILKGTTNKQIQYSNMPFLSWKTQTPWQPSISAVFLYQAAMRLSGCFLFSTELALSDEAPEASGFPKWRSPTSPEKGRPLWVQTRSPFQEPGSNLVFKIVRAKQVIQI